jgi:hypothetical protein
MPIILAIQEAEIRRIVVQSQPRQTVCKTLSRKTLHKNRAGGVTHGEGPEFKPQHCTKKEKRDGTKARPKDSRSNIKSYSSRSGTWDTGWHDMKSKGLGQPHPSSLAGCSSHVLFSGLMLLTVYSFPQQIVFHILDISNILMSPSQL